MSNFGFAGHGFSLKALLEDPSLQTAPSINNGGVNVKKQGKVGNHIPNASSAFLGSNIWENQAGENGSEFDLEYMDLDEFLSENGVPVNLDENDEAETISLLASALAKTPPQSPQRESSEICITPNSPIRNTGLIESVKDKSNVGVYLPDSPVNNPAMSPLSLSPVASPKAQEPQSAVERLYMQNSHSIHVSDYASQSLDIWEASEQTNDPSNHNNVPSDDSDVELVSSVPGQENFDPKNRKFSEEELKPQPIIKKSRKVFVDEHSKDDRYWQRRKKNNIAAKRSRDARRVKENQIAMRASFLESENDKLKEEVDQVRLENEELIKRLSKYEKV